MVKNELSNSLENSERVEHAIFFKAEFIILRLITIYMNEILT